MLLCDIASLSRLSITIVSLTGFPTPQKQPQQIRKKPQLQVALCHSKANVKGKERPVRNRRADTEPGAVATGCYTQVSFRSRIVLDRESQPVCALSAVPRRNHHPKRAARLGTPVRSRFCIPRMFPN